jgi:hypothetical protein
MRVKVNGYGLTALNSDSEKARRYPHLIGSARNSSRDMISFVGMELLIVRFMAGRCPEQCALAAASAGLLRLNVLTDDASSGGVRGLRLPTMFGSVLAFILQSIGACITSKLLCVYYNYSQNNFFAIEAYKSITISIVYHFVENDAGLRRAGKEGDKSVNSLTQLKRLLVHDLSLPTTTRLY